MLFLLMGILVLICIGYALFITVFDQIISQNEGFFYALVFGGILILAYLLINIIARLMLIPDKAHYSKALSVVCFVAFIGVCVLFAVSRLTYTSSVSPSEATYYSAGSLINNDALSVSSDLVNKLLNNPAQYVYSLLFSLIYGLLNESSFSLVLINVILCAISSLFAYLLITRFADKLCGLYAAAVVLFLPGQLFCVYSYSTECMFCPIFLATLYFGISVIETKSSALRILFGILYSLFASLLLLAEPVSIIFILLCILGGVFVRKNNALFVVLFSILAIGIFVGLMYLKAGHTGTDFADLLLGTLNCFDNKTVISTGSAATSEDIKTAFNALVSADNRHIENNELFSKKLCYAYHFCTFSETVYFVIFTGKCLYNSDACEIFLYTCIHVIIFFKHCIKSRKCLGNNEKETECKNRHSYKEYS